MAEITSCPACRQPVDSTDYFCRNCGKNIRPRPLSISIGSQLVLYFKTLLLPPLGFIWGFRYLRQSSIGSKLVGLFVIILTLAELIWLIQATVYAIDTVNRQLYQQMHLYGL